MLHLSPATLGKKTQVLAWKKSWQGALGDCCGKKNLLMHRWFLAWNFVDEIEGV